MLFSLEDLGRRNNHPPVGFMSWSDDGPTQTGFWVPRSLTDGDGNDLTPLLDNLDGHVLAVTADGVTLTLTDVTRKGNQVRFATVAHRHHEGAVYTFTAVARAEWEAARADARRYRERPTLAEVPENIGVNGDATEQLTDWLYSLPANTIADLRGRTYVSETPIKLYDRDALTIRNGHLTRLDAEHHGGLQRPHANPHLWLIGPHDCHVTDLTVTGTNTVSDSEAHSWTGAWSSDHELEAAIRIENYTATSVERVTVDGVWGDGVHCHGGTGMLIDALTVLRNGRQGITPNGRNIIIQGCVLNSRRAGIDLEPNWAGDVFGDVLIQGCTIRSRLLAITAGGMGEFSGVEVAYNTILRSGIPAINIRGGHGNPRDRWWVHHNQIGTPGDGSWAVGSPESAIRLGNSVGTVIEHNYVRVNPRGGEDRRRAVALLDGSGATIRNNWFAGASVAAYDRDGDSAFLAHNNWSGDEPPDWWEPAGVAAYNPRRP